MASLGIKNAKSQQQKTISSYACLLQNNIILNQEPKRVNCLTKDVSLGMLNRTVCTG